MLKQLRIKFVCITMLIITVMLSVIMGLVIHFTQDNMESQSVALMRTVASDMFQPDIPNAPPGMPEKPELPLPKMPMRYCMVSTNRYGEIQKISGDYDLIGSEELIELINQVNDSSEDSGINKKSGVRFLRIPQPGGFAYIFADMSFEQTMMSNLVRNCVLIGIASLGVLFFMSVLLAKWAIK
ncbi:MAG: hypothetical protein IJO16_01635, partial [Clostridia bacterium]|nr:hypothetical protein [Clostridia bacterium]